MPALTVTVLVGIDAHIEEMGVHTDLSQPTIERSVIPTNFHEAEKYPA
jgi:hypothetical protein